MDTHVPFVPLGCPTCPACPSHGGQTGQSCGHTHMYHCTWQSCLSCPSHVGWTGQSRGHTHVYHLTCLCPACPVLYMWDGQDSPMDIHTCVPLHLAVLSFPCGRVMSKFAITSPMSTRDCPHCPWVEMTVNWTIDILDYVTGIGNEIA